MGSKMKRGYASLITILALSLFCSCSKKSAETPEAAGVESGNKTAKSDPAVNKELQQVQQDLSAKKFEEATASMMRMQDMAGMMSEKDSERMHGQMRNLQTSLAQAAAAGDPNAQKAIMMLRMSSRENQMPMRR